MLQFSTAAKLCNLARRVISTAVYILQFSTTAKVCNLGRVIRTLCQRCNLSTAAKVCNLVRRVTRLMCKLQFGYSSQSLQPSKACNYHFY
jgi:hypothetical protein